MSERKRKHDDVHFPLGGKGARATRKRVYGVPVLVPTVYECLHRVTLPDGSCWLCGKQITDGMSSDR